MTCLRGLVYLWKGDVFPSLAEDLPRPSARVSLGPGRSGSMSHTIDFEGEHVPLSYQLLV